MGRPTGNRQEFCIPKGGGPGDGERLRRGGTLLPSGQFANASVREYPVPLNYQASLPTVWRGWHQVASPETTPYSLSFSVNLLPLHPLKLRSGAGHWISLDPFSQLWNGDNAAYLAERRWGVNEVTPGNHTRLHNFRGHPLWNCVTQQVPQNPWLS